MPVRKRRRRQAPRKALRVTTYERLKEYLGASAEGHFHLLILVGSGGLAKSRSVRAVLYGTQEVFALRGQRATLAGASSPSMGGRNFLGSVLVW